MHSVGRRNVNWANVYKPRYVCIICMFLFFFFLFISPYLSIYLFIYLFIIFIFIKRCETVKGWFQGEHFDQSSNTV